MQEDGNNNEEKKTRIKSYDYDAWSKFDVVSVYHKIHNGQFLEIKQF